MRFNRIAIMGAGSLGTILGAFMAKSGYDITLIDPNKQHVDALNAYGAKVIGHRDFTAPVHAITPDEMEGSYDLFIYMAKQTYNDVAIPQMLNHSHPDTCVCTCQNGIPEPELVKYFGADRVFGSPVGWGATWIGPGVSELTSNIDVISSSLGAMAAGKDEEIAEIKTLLETMCSVDVSDNLPGLRWSKLLMNATYSGMSTVCGCTFGQLMENDKSFDLLMQIGKECIDVARGAGIEMEPLHGFDFKEELYYTDQTSFDKARKAYRLYWKPHQNTEASMLQDLKKGRKCEIAAINGVVCKTGREFGVPTPVNDKVVEIVQSIEAGQDTFGFHQLSKFEEVVR